LLAAMSKQELMGDKLVIDWPGEKEQKSKIIRRAQ
jgi:hypothetical protein